MIIKISISLYYFNYFILIAIVAILYKLTYKHCIAGIVQRYSKESLIIWINHLYNYIVADVT